ncbi:unnamed protein product [Mytilus coruscus]|uniref:SRCR domain-containing protein n=1 Tax=Mytilus coruscus TaxID=42192 RepID=A0A6J8A3Y0_MYTCO|nr:unnamed protein product [Mytilus coruscus]
MSAYTSTCLLLIHSIGNIVLVAKEMDVICCESAEKCVIDCPINTMITVKPVTSGNADCETGVDNQQCLEHFDTIINETCSGKNNCTLSGSEFDRTDCGRIPKYIKVEYSCTCKTGWWWSRKNTVHRKSTDTCTTDLSNINCNSCSSGKIKINDVQEYDTSCNHCLNEVKSSVNKLCNGKKKCSSLQNDDVCHPRYVNIHYSCREEKMGTSPLPRGSSTERKVTIEAHSSTEEEMGTSSLPRESIERRITIETPTSTETKPDVQLDRQGRVLIYIPEKSKTFTACGSYWYNNDANVLCKYLDRSSYGIASQLPDQELISTIRLQFRCIGNETSLYECNSTFDGVGCNISTVAAAICCTEDNDPSECSSNTQTRSNMTPSMQLNVGVVIGPVVGVLLIACMIFIVFIRRSINSKKTKEKQNSDINPKDYSGTHDIAMPDANEHKPHYLGLEMKIRNKQCPGITSGSSSMTEMIHNDSAICVQTKGTMSLSNSKFTGNNYLVLDPNETGFNRSEGSKNTNWSYELAKPIHHGNRIKVDEGKSKYPVEVYASSEEGMYDSSHGNRHKESERNVYSHTIDNVYDSTSHTRNNDETEDSYDHFNGKKTEDDYEISK